MGKTGKSKKVERATARTFVAVRPLDVNVVGGGGRRIDTISPLNHRELFAQLASGTPHNGVIGDRKKKAH